MLSVLETKFNNIILNNSIKQLQYKNMLKGQIQTEYMLYKQQEQLDQINTYNYNKIRSNIYNHEQQRIKQEKQNKIEYTITEEKTELNLDKVPDEIYIMKEFNKYVNVDIDTIGYIKFIFKGQMYVAYRSRIIIKNVMYYKVLLANSSNIKQILKDFLYK